MDLEYLRNKYSNLIIIEFNIYDQAGLANWMAERVGRADELHTPAVFIGDHAWIGEGEIRPPQTIEPVLQTLEESGSPAFGANMIPKKAVRRLWTNSRKWAGSLFCWQAWWTGSTPPAPSRRLSFFCFLPDHQW